MQLIADDYNCDIKVGFNSYVGWYNSESGLIHVNISQFVSIKS